jgi:type I restriction enzyme R subunit
MTPRIIEDHIEHWFIETLQDKGFRFIAPEKLDPDVSTELRSGYSEVIIESYLAAAIARINPTLSYDVVKQAVREFKREIISNDLISSNQKFHALLIEGVDVTFQHNGDTKTLKAKILDDVNPENNDWCITHQLTIVENGQQKRPDVIIFVNGLPVIVVELKNAADQNADISKAFNQLKTYNKTIPSLFTCNCFEIISDGLEAKVGTITSDFSRFMSWKSADGLTDAPTRINELAVMINGMLKPEVLTELVMNFTVFEKYSYEDIATRTIRVGTVKKIAQYHQYYAVKKAVESTQVASSAGGNRKGGVVWHTQGSGKSLSMVFFTGMVVKALNNPTVIMITDRNDLDDQLFETFGNCSQLLRQVPVQIDSRSNLVTELKNRNSGGIFFTTIQKFFPEDGDMEYPILSERRNIIVLADEAHRTQYGFEAKVRYIKNEDGLNVGSDISYGFAKHMHDALPNATFLGFTGTPVEKNDKNTRGVFGDYIDIYDIQRAVLDGATVPIYYENRFAKLKLEKLFTDQLEEHLVKAAEGLPEYMVNSAISKATRQESIVGHPDRLQLIAGDIVNHFEDRAQVFSGKALIVAMSRRIAVALYDQIVSLRPQWHDERDEYGSIKVIMTGSSSDPEFLQPHVRNKAKRSLISARLKEESDPLQMVIVIDMWLTGFDAPVLHTMYLDKEMEGHNLMQAIARVNRVFKDKPGGLIVDYVPVTGNLKAALKTYTESSGQGSIAIDISEAVAVMLTKLEIVQQMLHGFDYMEYFDSGIERKLNIILEAEEHILTLDDGKERFIREVTTLSQAYALSKTEDAAKAITEEVAFFQAVKVRLAKFDINVTGQQRKDFENTIKNMVDSAVTTDGLINLLEQAGLDKPEISIFSEEFMDEIRNMKQRNVAIELLKKLLSDQIKVRFRRNIVMNKTFTERLVNAINRYNSKSITALEMMELLLEISKEVNHETARGKELNLTPTEKAFYDALMINRSARDMMGDQKLMEIARELVQRVKRSTTIDWTIRQSAKDKVKLEVKRVLRFHKYPPDDEPRATELVLEQAEMHAEELV